MPLYPPSVCQISRQSDLAFAFYSSFCKCVTRGRKIRKKKKTKKLSQFLKSHILGKREAISLKFGMWTTEVGGSVHSKNRLVHQGSTELRRCENCVFFLPVNILTGVARRLLGRHDTLSCVLMTVVILPDCRVCFATPVTNMFSSLVMEEVPQYLEPLGPVHLVPSLQLQRRKRVDKLLHQHYLIWPFTPLLRCYMRGLLLYLWLQDLQWNKILVYLQ